MNPLREHLKRAAFRFFPDTALTLSAVRSRRMIARQVRALGLDRVCDELARHQDRRVASGPFRGMRYDWTALSVHSSPKLLGTYELEIAQFVEDAIAQRPLHVLNVGCSDGYYAVGFACRLPDAAVYASDADPASKSATRHNAQLNGVQSRIRTEPILHPGEFNRYLKQPGSLLVMDVEGAEFQLLRPDVDPILKATHMLVEIHPHAGAAADLISRFERTHTIKIAQGRRRELSDMPVDIAGLDALSAMDERRSNDCWLYLEARERGSSAQF